MTGLLNRPAIVNSFSIIMPTVGYLPTPSRMRGDAAPRDSTSPFSFGVRRPRGSRDASGRSAGPPPPWQRPTTVLDQRQGQTRHRVPTACPPPLGCLGIAPGSRPWIARGKRSGPTDVVHPAPPHGVGYRNPRPRHHRLCVFHASSTGPVPRTTGGAVVEGWETHLGIERGDVRIRSAEPGISPLGHHSDRDTDTNLGHTALKRGCSPRRRRAQTNATPDSNEAMFLPTASIGPRP